MAGLDEQTIIQSWCFVIHVRKSILFLAGFNAISQLIKLNGVKKIRKDS